MFEVTLGNSGIMKLGWATSSCNFSIKAGKDGDRAWRVQIDRKGSVQKVGKENVARTWSLDETFRPKITPRAQRKKAHSVEELHEGGRLQRERTLVIHPILEGILIHQDVLGKYCSVLSIRVCWWCSRSTPGSTLILQCLLSGIFSGGYFPHKTCHPCVRAWLHCCSSTHCWGLEPQSNCLTHKQQRWPVFPMASISACAERRSTADTV